MEMNLSEMFGKNRIVLLERDLYVIENALKQWVTEYMEKHHAVGITADVIITNPSDLNIDVNFTIKAEKGCYTNYEDFRREIKVAIRGIMLALSYAIDKGW